MNIIIKCYFYFENSNLEPTFSGLLVLFFIARVMGPVYPSTFLPISIATVFFFSGEKRLQNF
jgi:hypothetical protein